MKFFNFNRSYNKNNIFKIVKFFFIKTNMENKNLLKYRYERAWGDLPMI